jgi:hypothetical protein
VAEVVRKVGDVGHRWSALKPLAMDVATVFYVKASTLWQKATLVDKPTRERKNS